MEEVFSPIGKVQIVHETCNEVHQLVYYDIEKRTVWVSCPRCHRADKLQTLIIDMEMHREELLKLVRQEYIDNMPPKVTVGGKKKDETKQ